MGESVNGIGVPLPEPKVTNWQKLYELNARAVCVKDNPPMRGFGRDIKAGDVVDVHAVCFAYDRYEIAVRSELAFYELEGYFVPVMEDFQE